MFESIKALFGAKPPQTLDEMVQESQRLGKLADDIRTQRLALRAQIDAEVAKRAPQGLPAGVIAKGN